VALEARRARVDDEDVQGPGPRTWLGGTSVVIHPAMPYS
jgi:hypothetical protein